MNQKPFVTEVPRISPWARLSATQITELLFDASHVRSWWNFLFEQKPVFITGSSVYKGILRGEKFDDIDAVCNNSKDLSNSIKKLEPSAYNPTIDLGSFEWAADYTTIKFRGSDMKIDLVGYRDYANTINRFGFGMINCLVLTHDGIKHIFEVPEVAQHIALRAENPKAERDWAVDKIKKGEYCEWRNMREKDKEYFKKWKVIDPVECAMHGIFKD